MDRVRLIWSAIMNEVRARPRMAAAVCACVLVAGIGVLSCQTTPRAVVGRPAAQPGGEPDVRVRIKALVASAKIGGAGQFAVQPLSGDPAIMDGPLTVSATERGTHVVDARGVSRDFGMSALELVPAGDNSAAA